MRDANLECTFLSLYVLAIGSQGGHTPAAFIDFMHSEDSTINGLSGEVTLGVYRPGLQTPLINKKRITRLYSLLVPYLLVIVNSSVCDSLHRCSERRVLVGTSLVSDVLALGPFLLPTLPPKKGPLIESNGGLWLGRGIRWWSLVPRLVSVAFLVIPMSVQP